MVVSACANTSLPANQEPRDGLFAHFAPFPIFDGGNPTKAGVYIFWAEGDDAVAQSVAAYITKLEQAGFVSADGYFWVKGDANFSAVGRMVFFRFEHKVESMETAMDTVLNAFPPFEEDFGTAQSINLYLEYAEISDETLENYLQELKSKGFEYRQILRVGNKDYEFEYDALRFGPIGLTWTYSD
jgi:hypothetical protein